jgi:hypothetical protein
MDTDRGPIALDRVDGSLATLSVQGQPDRAVALKRRETAELITEELRRLDPDDTYASALRFGVQRLNSVPAARVQDVAAVVQSEESPAQGESAQSPVEPAVKATVGETTAREPREEAAAK